MIGSSHKSNAFTHIASLAAAGAGVGVALDGLQKLGEIPKMQEFVLDTGEKLISEFVNIGIGSRDELQKSFNADELRQFTSQIEQENKATANHTISIILAIFGINRLYLRKWKSGILFLITYGGLGVWWAIDLYKVIKKDFNPKW